MIQSTMRPIFISGVYRSGTTFLTAVLNRLPSIAAASSTVKYLRFCLPLYPDLDSPSVLDQLLNVTNQRISERWSLTLDVEAIKTRIAHTPLQHSIIYNEIMYDLLLKNSKSATRWAEKLAMQWRDIPKFLEMFPGGKVVHIFRDPRDVTASYKHMTYEPWPTYLDAALNCTAAMIELPRLVDRYGSDRILTLRAEDLALDLPGQMCTICDFLGETYSDDLSDINSFGDIKGEDWRTNTSFDSNSSNFAKAEVRWKNNLTNAEIFLVEMICQPYMSDHGYRGSGNSLDQVSFPELAHLLSDNWLSSRIQHFLETGLPHQGYRSDPLATEMKIVFGD